MSSLRYRLSGLSCTRRGGSSLFVHRPGIPDGSAAPCDVVALLGRAGGPRTCDRAIMRRFSAVHRIPPGVVLAGQVGCAVCLVISGLASCAWWNDCENDRRSPSWVVGETAHDRARLPTSSAEASWQFIDTMPRRLATISSATTVVRYEVRSSSHRHSRPFESNTDSLFRRLRLSPLDVLATSSAITIDGPPVLIITGTLMTSSGCIARIG